MSETIFSTLNAMEVEADALVERAREQADALHREGETEVTRIREVLTQKVSGLRHTMHEELQGEMARMREEAAARLAVEQDRLQKQAQAGYPQAVAAVVKECLGDGHC